MDASWRAVIAVNRFGLGARPGERVAVASDPQGWLKAQIAAPEPFAVAGEGLPSVADAAQALLAYFQDRQAQRRLLEAAANMGEDAQKQLRQAIAPIRDYAVAESLARTRKALTTEAGFAERLALFWSNKLTVSATKLQTIPFAGSYEREVIRAGMTGTFEQLLVSACRHPGMLLYLDQAQSAGPNSVAGRRRDAGLNENLAREVLELHTLGAQGGYTQADVTEFAKALTGWTTMNPRLAARRGASAPMGSFVFEPLMHEPGARTVLGKRYPEGGEEQALAILRDLARHPATARQIATRLARHFIADQPPASAVARLERAFLEGEGSLPALHTALVDLPEAWSQTAQKFKSPNDFLVSALRLRGVAEVEPRALQAAYQLLGQAPWQAPSPEGWPDDAASWSGADALMKRLEWSQAYAERTAARIRPEAVAEEGLGPALTGATRQAIMRAASAAQGFTLALMSPEFQRR